MQTWFLKFYETRFYENDVQQNKTFFAACFLVTFQDFFLSAVLQIYAGKKSYQFLKCLACPIRFLDVIQKWFMFVNTGIQHCFVAAHSTTTNPQICVSLCRARTSHSVAESIMFTAPSKVTSLSLTTLKALKSRRRSTRYGGCPRKTQHNSFCPQMVSKTILTKMIYHPEICKPIKHYFFF